MSQKFDDNEWQFYLIIFFMVILCFLFIVAMKFFWVRVPDMNTPEGRCEAVCVGLQNKIYIGHGYPEQEPLTCFCKNPPTPPDKMLLRKP